MSTNIYHYSKEYNHYTKTTVARMDPKNPTRVIVPAYATTSALPTVSEGEVAIWNGSSWDVQTDYRGQTFIDTSTLEVTYVEDPNFTPSGTQTTTLPSSSLVSPSWNGSSWDESASIFQGRAFESAAEVDEYVNEKIISDGGAKKMFDQIVNLLASAGQTTEWSSFSSDVNQLITDAETFKSTEGLT